MFYLVFQYCHIVIKSFTRFSNVFPTLLYIYQIWSDFQAWRFTWFVPIDQHLPGVHQIIVGFTKFISTLSRQKNKDTSLHWLYGYQTLPGWWFGTCFSIQLGIILPNWLSLHHFSEGYTTNQLLYINLVLREFSGMIHWRTINHPSNPQQPIHSRPRLPRSPATAWSSSNPIWWETRATGPTTVVWLRKTRWGFHEICMESEWC